MYPLYYYLPWKTQICLKNLIRFPHQKFFLFSLSLPPYVNNWPIFNLNCSFKNNMNRTKQKKCKKKFCVLKISSVCVEKRKSWQGKFYLNSLDSILPSLPTPNYLSFLYFATADKKKRLPLWKHWIAMETEENNMILCFLHSPLLLTSKISSRHFSRCLVRARQGYKNDGTRVRERSTTDSY